MIIKDVEFKDIPILIELYKSLHKESYYSQISFNEERLYKNIENLIIQSMEPDVFFKVCTDEEQVFAFFIGYLTDYFFSDELTSTSP